MPSGQGRGRGEGRGRGGAGGGGGRGAGRGGGRGRGRGGRRRVMSFLQPCLLVMLHKESAHGYSLLDGLGAFGFNPNVDPSLVYRVLREMEDLGLVSSEWDDDSLGPQRRVYSITPAGEEYLATWVADLGQTRNEIDALLSAYKKESRSE
jgi:PadR family transcriptional regulator PadR